MSDTTNRSVDSAPSVAQDDIVTRLRKQIPIPLEFADEGAPAHLIAQAADEIERLRADRDRWSADAIKQARITEELRESYNQLRGEIERLRKLMSDYVSLWFQLELSTVGNTKETRAYYAKFHEMKEAVRGD